MSLPFTPNQNHMFYYIAGFFSRPKFCGLLLFISCACLYLHLAYWNIWNNDMWNFLLSQFWSVVKHRHKLLIGGAPRHRALTRTTLLHDLISMLRFPRVLRMPFIVLSQEQLFYMTWSQCWDSHASLECPLLCGAMQGNNTDTKTTPIKNWMCSILVPMPTASSIPVIYVKSIFIHRKGEAKFLSTL